MARKSAGKSPAGTVSNLDDAESAPLKICFERILPENLDPDHTFRRAMRGMMLPGPEDTLNADAVQPAKRMGIILSKKWTGYTQLRCRFIGGLKSVQTKVEAVAHKWEQHARIKFKFVKSGDAEIRIAFISGDGSWSAVGRDALVAAYFPKHQPTMNFGWLTPTSHPDEYERVVLHEFGHALGCIHEHQQPKFDRAWNRPKVLQVFSGSPNFWTKAEIEHNVLKKYSPAGIEATDFDAKSIMLYSFDGGLFTDGKGPTNSNTKLSALDVKLIKKMYP